MHERLVVLDNPRGPRDSSLSEVFSLFESQVYKKWTSTQFGYMERSWLRQICKLLPSPFREPKGNLQCVEADLLDVLVAVVTERSNVILQCSN